MKPSNRVQSLVPYMFAKLSEMKRLARQQGHDIIDLSVGDPDLEPPKILVEKLKKHVSEPRVHSYPPYNATEPFRNAAAGWMARRHGACLDAQKEITGVIGVKEGIAHFLLAVINEGDVVAFPTPHYPAYFNAVKLAGGIPHLINLSPENNFVPDLDAIPDKVWKKIKVLILNYPHNPTSVAVDEKFWQQAVDKAKQFGFIICSDAAYLEIYDEKRCASFLSAKGAKEVGVEFHSFSKTFSIPGWRLGFVAGNSDLIDATRQVKQSVDSGQFMPLDLAAAELLQDGDEAVDGMRAVYASRRKFFRPQLEGMGYKIYSSPASLYLWAKVPRPMTSEQFAKMLIDKAQIFVTPGTVFGNAGEGFIRFSLTVPHEKLEEAAKRLCRL